MYLFNFSQKVFSKKLFAIPKTKKALELHKLIYKDMCIVDVRKALMYDFHCNYINKKNINKFRLLLTYTDRRTCELESNHAW